ncbi:MAG: LacI family transcriptional regulator [Wenzhouxiangella sp.]|nr:MAG: LacI family transcriptional regulator [Wenzhouxiangella sp.]
MPAIRNPLSIRKARVESRFMANSTITDVARLAGVSIKTVSRVVNREDAVREATRARVEAAIAKLGYAPNQSARDLASRRAHLVCLIYDDPSAYELPSAGYIIRLQEGVLRVCRSQGYELLIHPCSYRRRGVTRELEALIRRARPAGIVLAAPLSNTRSIVAAITATGTPLVRLAPGLKRAADGVVATNDREFSAEMVRYLASCGHQRIAFITGHPDHKAVGMRYLGYRDGLQQSGLTFSSQLVAAGDNSFGAGEAAGMQLLEREPRPTAIFAANDDMAVGVMRAALRLGITIPDALSVAGCDDITLAEQVLPPLTTIRQPFAAMAEQASLMLVKGMPDKQPGSGHFVFKGTLKIRGSTGPAP